MRAGDDGTGDYEMIGSTEKGHERAQRGTPTWKTYTACGSRSFLCLVYIHTYLTAHEKRIVPVNTHMLTQPAPPTRHL